MLHPVGGLLPPPGKAVGALLAFLPGEVRPVGLGPGGRLPLLPALCWSLLPAFQLSDSGFQSLITAEEVTNEFNQLFAGGHS